MRNRQVVDWTPELIERLRYLWKEGVSAAQIARLFDNGATKNSIIGKAHRLKLAMRHMPSGTHPRGVRRSTKPRKPRASRAKGAPGASLPLPVPEPPPPPPVPLRTPPAPPKPPPPPRPQHIEDMVKPIGRKISLLELRTGDCKWPLNSPPRGGTYLFCGEPQFNGWAYCEYHSRIGYAGTKRQERVSGWQPRQAGF